ncbi:SRPBCC family protein [Nocardia caishijiensis]|uniref:Polyketide cyclase/dehydrase/lipid transport protein n=1 Tax=Nocardia caishijiensis TaxID=184756 RepID=A0ABQ6YG62_9NOCA|nr:SRPBCC family protein [Nocardia caishijiensis]KAF0844782.1 polyketide cyclase/dehydrase/lipid transport protein [Nocardia caishijiensis]
MRRTFTLAESDDRFLATAARRHVHVVDVPTASEHVWAALTADDALVSWANAVTDVRWHSPRPFGVGTVRTVTLARGVALTERFFRWDEGRRMTFTVDSASIPGLRRFAEDIVVEPAGADTRVTWTFALEGEPALRPILWAGAPVNALVTGSIARGLTRGALAVARRDPR